MKIHPECAQQICDFLSRSKNDPALTLTNLASAVAANIPNLKNLTPGPAPRVPVVAPEPPELPEPSFEGDDLDPLDPEGFSSGNRSYSEPRKVKKKDK